MLDQVQTMLDRDPAIESGSCRARVTSFVGAAYQMELFAYGRTGDLGAIHLNSPGCEF